MNEDHYCPACGLIHDGFFTCDGKEVLAEMKAQITPDMAARWMAQINPSEAELTKSRARREAITKEISAGLGEQFEKMMEAHKQAREKTL